MNTLATQRTNPPPHFSLGMLALIVPPLLAACAGQRLKPAPEAQLVPGNPDVAVAENQGVRITVDPDAWSGYPSTLEQEMTPIKVTIENRGSQPLRIRYNEFALRTPNGIQYSALPPLEIEGTARVTRDRPVFAPRFAYSGFYVAPWYHPYYYTGLNAWGYPWAFDSLYYDRYYPVWHVELPTRDMREQAIPEGVLEPGGRVSGFLYFPEISTDTDRVTFSADLMNGKDGKGFGKLTVPFVVG